MKKTNPIEESQRLRIDNDYLRSRLRETKEIIMEKDKIIAELKKNLDCTKTKTLLLL